MKVCALQILSTLEIHFEERLRKVSFSVLFGGQFIRISVDGRPNRSNKVAFSNLSGVVWTGPYLIHGKKEVGKKMRKR